nr:reverse transcriptase domain-containing protein [Tanacetum cinerariifolium]
MQLKKQIEELVRAGKLSHLIKEIKQGWEQPKAGRKEAAAKDKPTAIYMVRSWQRTGPLIIEAEIGGHTIHRMYIDGGSSMEILYEHCFNRLRPDIKSQMIPATTSLTGFSGEITWPLGQLRLLVTIGDVTHSTKAWMNFMIVKSLSPYNGIIGRPGLKAIQAVPSTVHGMLKFPTEEGIVTIRSTLLIPAECALVDTSSVTLEEKKARPSNLTVPLHPNFPDQEVVVGGSLSDKGRTELCSLLKKNLDIFAWQPSDMTGVTQSVAEHRLNVREGCLPDCYPLPEIDWKVESLCGYPFKWFLDAYKGYHQIQLVTADEEKTTFHTGHGVYCYTKMPFCLKNAGATYQRLMDKAFESQMGRNIEVYVDDLVVKSYTEAEMVRDIEETDETTWPLGQLKLLVTIGDATHSTKAWMNFMIVKSLSPYNGIIERPGSLLIAAECASVDTSSVTPREKKARPANLTVPLHLNFPDQEVVGGSLSDKGRTELCSLLKKNLDIFAWQPSDMTGVPLSVIEHRLNDCYPLPEIDWKVESLCGYPFKCFLDAYKGYHKIQMAAADEEKTAFHTGQGVYCYTKMPFGLKNASATYQRLMDKAFKNQMGRNIEVYVDDLVVKSHTEVEMVRDIEETFQTLRKINMKLNPKKCSFGLTEGVFLGYVITPEGIKPCSDKTTAVLQQPSPQTIKEVKSLNGKLASLNSAVLMTERGMVQMPVYFISRALQVPELNYSPMEKLVLSLVFAAKRLRRYFQAHPIAVITNQPIKQVMSRPDVAGRLQKWSIMLGEHNITYRPRTSIKGQILAAFPNKMPSNASQASNNEAEYEALIAGLRIAMQMGEKNIQVNVDSKLVANQVLGAYVAKEENIIKYLEITKGLVSGFKTFSISQVPRSRNKKADALSKIASISFAYLSKQILVKVLETKSITGKEVTAMIEEKGPTWMTKLVNYLKEGILPGNENEARKLRLKAHQYELIEGVLYKRSFLTP